MITYYYSPCFEENCKNFYDKVFYFIKELSSHYPQIKDWYYKVFLSGFHNGERLILWAENEQHNLVGILLLKHNGEEDKICNIYVSPDYRRQGIGTGLLRLCFRVLENFKPRITVSEDVFGELFPLLNKFGFKLDDIKEGQYIAGKKEFYLS